MTYHSRTIAATATPPGKGGVSLIRLSGDDALAVADSCFLSARGELPSSFLPRHAVYGHFIINKITVDDGIVTVFRAPHSYTGEDTVELSCHGGRLITEKILSALFAAGAVQAEAGEFSRRAFASGKLTLSEAEAVADIIDAKTDSQLLASANAAGGALSRALNGMYEKLKNTAAAEYAKVDFPDEDLSELSPDEVRTVLSEVISGCDRLLSGYSTARAVFDGVSCVICGRPNTGKSSLYNALSGRELAIVTETAGTTRDRLETEIPCGRVLLRLIDTAGLRRTADNIEKIGVRLALEAINEAELVLAVFDGSAAMSAEDREIIEKLSSVSCTKIAILNKSDKPADDETVKEAESAFEYSVKLSAKSGEGIEGLRELIEKLYTDEKIDLSSDAMIRSARQSGAVTAARAALVRARTALDMDMPADIVCCDIEYAMQQLGGIDGREVSEDIVADIFSRFCVGK